MSIIDRLFKKSKGAERPKAFTSTAIDGYWGEPREVDYRGLLRLALSDASVRMCIDAYIAATASPGYRVVSPDEVARSVVEAYLAERSVELGGLVKRLVSSLMFFDEAFIETTSDFPRLIAPWTVSIVRDEYGRVERYIQHEPRRVELGLDEMVHVVSTPYLDFAYPIPRLQTLYRLILTKREAEVFYYQVLMRKGIPAKAFIYRGLDAATFNEAVRAVQGSKPGDTLALMGDWTVQDLGSPVKDLELHRTIESIEQRILALFGVPRIILGFTEAATLETSRNQLVVFQQRVRDLQELVATALTEAFKRILGAGGFTLKFNEWTSAEQLTRLTAQKLEAGIISINEARALLGLPELELEYAKIPLPPVVSKVLGERLSEALDELAAGLLRGGPVSAET
ncbi:MAG: phage portal protein [Nitrososphaerota archaeon]|nr:phage portal protein [Candidatus Calditenuaceae archaeon]MDW8073948.1 phage portal protein [Nitrososphaerota archaeon]